MQVNETQRDTILGIVGIAMAAIVLIYLLFTLSTCGANMEKSSIIKTCLTSGNPVSQCMSINGEVKGE